MHFAFLLVKPGVSGFLPASVIGWVRAASEATPPVNQFYLPSGKGWEEGSGRACSDFIRQPRYYSALPPGLVRNSVTSKYDLSSTPGHQSWERPIFKKLGLWEAGDQGPLCCRDRPHCIIGRSGECVTLDAHLGSKVLEEPERAEAQGSGSRGWTEHRVKITLDCEFLDHIPRELKPNMRSSGSLQS